MSRARVRVLGVGVGEVFDEIGEIGVGDAVAGDAATDDANVGVGGGLNHLLAFGLRHKKGSEGDAAGGCLQGELLDQRNTVK
ncbi:uncharacterized protein A4U43_C10F14600 [Asparagus officinalis]|uniref:Uncharacterized protein n=1 Tax=Asparagus officinalis TaxID=4686 RepID=A0A5P1E7J9_ASPOF|nr:uncharacterized protein A4U43_C10F14600 [Asparagus officinalis]